MANWTRSARRSARETPDVRTARAWDEARSALDELCGALRACDHTNALSDVEKLNDLLEDLYEVATKVP